ncbi:hypothetical protein C8R47DRAFT_1324535 [Mycena vitilis]|nr:hypothetical protein C8R47DRAFT_1324535 [Mycena vitilis]
MFFSSTLLFGAAVVLPSVMGLTLDTPVTTDADGTLEVTWQPADADPAVTLLLKGPISIGIATGIAAATAKASVGLGQIPPGKYTLMAVNADDIETVLSTSQEFTIAAAGDPAGAPPPPPPPPAAGAPPPPAAGKGTTSTVTVTVTVTETPAAAAATEAAPPANAAATVTVTETLTVTAGGLGAAPTAQAGKGADPAGAKPTDAAKAAAPAKPAAPFSAKPATASKPKRRMVFARTAELHLD